MYVYALTYFMHYPFVKYIPFIQLGSLSICTHEIEEKYMNKGTRVRSCLCMHFLSSNVHILNDRTNKKFEIIDRWFEGKK